MAKTVQPINNATEPFDLATALRYMKDNGEVIRCLTEKDDFYFFLDVQRRPIVVNGRRQWQEVEKVIGFNQWNNEQLQLELCTLTKAVFYLMSFDEAGEPIWDLPGAGAEEVGESASLPGESAVAAEE